jgi:hypothetical protein
MQRRWLSRGIGVCIAVIVLFAGYTTPPVQASGTTRTVDTCTIGDTNSLDTLLGQSADGDTITFSVNCTGANAIMPAGQLSVGHSITIDGSGHTVVVDGTASGQRIFSIPSTSTVTMSNLTITNGATAGNGGGIFSLGTLTLDHVALTGNTASNSTGGGGGLWSDGTLTVTNSTISDNHATGASGTGGGLRVANGSAALTNVTTSGNSAANSGAGIFTGNGTVTLTNTIVAGNTDTTAGTTSTAPSRPRARIT